MWTFFYSPSNSKSLVWPKFRLRTKQTFGHQRRTQFLCSIHIRYTTSTLCAVTAYQSDKQNSELGWEELVKKVLDIWKKLGSHPPFANYLTYKNFNLSSIITVFHDLPWHDSLYLLKDSNVYIVTKEDILSYCRNPQKSIWIIW